MQRLSFNFSGLKVIAEQPADPAQLFDELVAKASDHPDVVDERIPYWAEIWPSSIALSEYIVEHKNLVTGKHVLEIGCGPGLPGIVAALCGANVELTDYMQEAIDLAEHNWKLNLSTNAMTSLFDWRYPGDKKADVILASDVAYESRAFEPLIKTFQSILHENGVILMSEPNRRYSCEFFNRLSDNGFQFSKSNKNISKDSLKYLISIYCIRR